ncbi:FecR family protein [Alteromonas flava]|uniref:FecR family protein n=1 Tax=Alteromonas flava TaxID=2048003 RepID=UPI000C29564A|nr:FecR domain-containing protein [Alteromonas flava]
MNNVHRFNTREDIQEQACVWISRIDRGLNEQETDLLAKWISGSNAHREVLFEMASLWDDMSVLQELSGLFPLPEQKAEVSEKKPTIYSWQLAASVAFLVLAVGAIVISQLPQPDNSQTVTTQLASTQIGEQRSMTLSDGSILHLNTNSAVSIAFSDTQRRISLTRGEAFFEVAHEQNRPFVVAAGANTVTAIGTAFNVQLIDDAAFELVVTDGRVLIQDRAAQKAAEDTKVLQDDSLIVDDGLLVFSGEKALVDKQVTERSSISENDMNDDLAWQKGMLVFKGESLEDVLTEISRYTDIRFQIIDSSLKEYRVAGHFKVGDTAGLLNALENGFSIQHEQVSQFTILLSKGA